MFVPASQLKAVFFVRDFAGNADYVEQRSFDSAVEGRRIEVTFGDDEVLVGLTLAYRTDGLGFFLTPADSAATTCAYSSSRAPSATSDFSDVSRAPPEPSLN